MPPRSRQTSTYKMYYVNYSRGYSVENSVFHLLHVHLGSASRIDRGGRNQISESRPSNTTTPSPDKLGDQLSLLGLPRRIFSDRPERVWRSTGPFARPQAVSKIAVATEPLPHAKVSASTPRSYVRIRQR